jgi:hypothetical protein
MPAPVVVPPTLTIPQVAFQERAGADAEQTQTGLILFRERPLPDDRTALEFEAVDLALLAHGVNPPGA